MSHVRLDGGDGLADPCGAPVPPASGGGGGGPLPVSWGGAPPGAPAPRSMLMPSGWGGRAAGRCPGERAGRVENNDVGEAPGVGRDRQRALVGRKGVEQHERVGKGGIESSLPGFGIHFVVEGVSCPGQRGAAFGVAGDGDGGTGTGVGEKSGSGTGRREGNLNGFAHVDEVDGWHI